MIRSCDTLPLSNCQMVGGGKAMWFSCGVPANQAERVPSRSLKTTILTCQCFCVKKARFPGRLFASPRLPRLFRLQETPTCSKIPMPSFPFLLRVLGLGPTPETIYRLRYRRGGRRLVLRPGLLAPPAAPRLAPAGGDLQRCDHRVDRRSAVEIAVAAGCGPGLRLKHGGCCWETCCFFAYCG